MVQNDWQINNTVIAYAEHIKKVSTSTENKINLLSMSVSMSSDSVAVLGLWIFGLMTKGHSFLDRSTSC